VIRLLAHGTGGSADAFTTAMLLLAGFVGWVAVQRLRGRGYERVSRPMAGAMAGAAAGCLVLAFINPWFSKVPASVRPSTTARVQILSPTPDEVFHGNPATVDLQVRLTGGRLVPFTSTKLVPNAGHLHVFLDSRLVTMTQGLSQPVSVAPGAHRLAVEFVAVDHAPFNPDVFEQVSFIVRG
jgi:hypothetical protein